MDFMRYEILIVVSKWLAINDLFDIGTIFWCSQVEERHIDNETTVITGGDLFANHKPEQ